MAKEKDKDDEDGQGKAPELTIVTDDERNLEVAPTGPETDSDDLPKPKVKVAPKAEDHDEDDEEDEGDSRLGASEESEAEEEAKQKQKSHKSRRQRQKDAERRLRTERDFLEKRNEDLEKEVMGLKKRMDSSDRSTLEARIAHTKAQIAKAEKIAADATTAGEGDEAIEAARIKDNLRDHLKNMEERYEQMDRAEREPAQQKEPARPEVAANARAWMSRTKWFDPQLGDRDSRIVRALDIEVNEDGFDPGTPEYFDELDKRIAEVLPHRAGKKKRQVDAGDEDVEDLEEDEEETPKPKAKSGKPNGANGKKPAGGPKFRTGGPGRALKSDEVYLSPERIAAMKEVGAWDDPVLRQKYLKKYQQWDQENPRD